MSNYIKQYDNVAAYLSSKASGELYTLLTDTAVFSRTIISYIKTTGNGGYQTAVDSVNCICETSDMQVGDVLCYNSPKSKHVCLKGGSLNTATVGGNIVRASSIPVALGLTAIGWCVERIGRKCWIAAMDKLSTRYQMCSDNTTTLSGIYTDSKVMMGNGVSNWIGSGSMELAEARYGASRYQYTWPITRTEWNVAAINASITGADNVTINKGDYNNDFDTYYRQVILVRHPLRWQGTGSHSGYALADDNGRAQTAALLAAVTSSFTCPAATACDSYTFTGIGSGYLPSLGQMWRLMKYYKRLLACGFPYTYEAFWTSTQSSSDYAWSVNFNAANVNTNYRISTIWVLPFADFQIN